MNVPNPTDLLAQIAQIQLMERGKLSTYHFKDRSAPSGPYFKLQCWEHGKNLTRHVRSEQVPLLEQALAGHAKFQQLVEQYAQIVIDQTRQQLAGVGVKKKPGPRPNSFWRRNRRSDS
jgi:hypothetical protein